MNKSQITRKNKLNNICQSNIKRYMSMTGLSFAKTLRKLKLPFSKYRVTTKQLSGYNSRIVEAINEIA